MWGRPYVPALEDCRCIVESARPMIDAAHFFIGSKTPVGRAWALGHGGSGRRSEAKRLRQPDKMKGTDTEPVDIKLIAGEAMADAAWIGVVVVVPALTKRQ
jgi:hypothetical protein